MKRGVYFLADDGVFELVVAFLNSFRQYNPKLSLCLIPFNSNVERVKSLQESYGFSIYTKTDVLVRCDEISTRFHPRVIGQYRKLAAWEGDFDEFIYIDVDTIVLAKLDFIFKFLAEYSFVTSHSNKPEIVKFVWKPTIYASGVLSDEQIKYATNTGFIASQKGALTLDIVSGKLDRAVELAPHMALFCIEQPFLNYLIVTSGREYTSLSALALARSIVDMPHEYWAGNKLRGIKIENGQVLLNGESRRVLLLHWAGEWQPRLADKLFFWVIRSLRIRKQGSSAIRFFMPYKILWEYYRYLRE